MSTAVTKKRTSISGILSDKFSKASRKGRPKFCSSKVVRNSPATGSGNSVVIISSPVEKECPARTARPSRSIASGNIFSNAFSRLLRLKATTLMGIRAPMGRATSASTLLAETLLTITYAPRAIPALSKISLPAFTFLPAWLMKSRNLSDHFHFRRMRWSAGTSLRSSSRTTLSSNVSFPRFALRSIASRRFATTLSGARPPTEAKRTPPTIKTMTKKVNPANARAILLSLADTCRCMFEHFRRQVDTGGYQSFRKLRTDTGRNKFTQHFTILANAHFLVDKNILHGYYFAFHARNLRQVGHAAFAVAQAGDLNNDIDC